MTVAWTTDTVTPDASRAIHYTLLWGLDGVVLRTLGKAHERVPFINEGTLRRRLEADEVPLLAIDPGLFEGSSASRATWMNELESFDDIGSFCERLGVSLVLTGALASDPETYDADAAAEALRQLGDRVARWRLTLGVRNEAGSAVATGSALAELLRRANHPAVRGDWRPFDACVAGEDPAAGLAALLDVAEVASVTVRDALPSGEPAIPGDGQVDWEGQLHELARREWNGLVTLEIHGRPAGPFGLHAASAMISAVRRAKRSRVA